ncbi:MAG: hydantoinase B/oxoprolinase family protein, partial [Pseudomonadales bacterium]
CDRVQVKEGDILYFNTWGGGGAGDPFERETERVGMDVARGLVTVEGARRYGVVCDESGNVDDAATQTLREELRAARPEVPLFDFGGTIEEIKERCKEETGLEPPATPVFARRAGG